MRTLYASCSTCKSETALMMKSAHLYKCYCEDKSNEPDSKPFIPSLIHTRVHAHTHLHVHTCRTRTKESLSLETFL